MELLKLLCLGIIMLIIDILWIGYFSNYFTDYKNTIEKVQKTKMTPRYEGGVLAYLLMFLGFIVFVYPNVKKSTHPISDSLYFGGIYGLTVYGIYNGTNYFTFENWDKQTVFVDSAWGFVLYSIMALLANKINKIK